MIFSLDLLGDTYLRKDERKHRASAVVTLGFGIGLTWLDLIKYITSNMIECSTDVFLGSRRVGCGPVAAWVLLKVALE